MRNYRYVIRMAIPTSTGQLRVDGTWHGIACTAQSSWPAEQRHAGIQSASTTQSKEPQIRTSFALIPSDEAFENLQRLSK